MLLHQAFLLVLATRDMIPVYICLILLIFFFPLKYMINMYFLDDLMIFQKPGWRKFLSYVGPGFLVSLAYLDPGNCESLSLSPPLFVCMCTYSAN